METLEQDDRKWRRTKPKKWHRWAKALMRPQTWKTMVAVGIQITRLVWIVYRIVDFMRW